MQPDLDNISLHDLSQLLILKTTEFIKLSEQKNSDGYKVRDLKLEVETIQKKLNLRKSENRDGNSA